MLRTLALTILLTFTANSAFALTAKEVVLKGKIIASGVNGVQITMTVYYEDVLYQCYTMPQIVRCFEIKKDELKRK